VLLLVDVRNGQVTVFRRQNSTFRKRFSKIGLRSVLRSVIRILCASLAQIDTEMAEKYAKLGKAAKFRSLYTISEEETRFRHPDYDPDLAQKLISSSMSRHLSTRNISSKSMRMRTFLSNLGHRQTDKRARACGRKHIPPPLSEVNNNKRSK